MRRLAAIFLAALSIVLVCPAASSTPKTAPKSASKSASKSGSKAPSKSASAPRPSAPRFSNAYASPTSKKRPVRKATQFIILHTTEGAAVGSLKKLRDNGECHYVVDKEGVIYRIVDRRKVALHCGCSMWNNVRDLSMLSIGIEIVGYHNKELTAAQYASLKYLLADLKRIYKIPDDRILTHSMVAYGEPNVWHKKKHRGRKRCAMLLADPARRRRMGILSKPAYDPDLRAGRLVDADPALTRILYPPVSKSAAATTTPAPKPVAPAASVAAKPPATPPAKPSTGGAKPPAAPPAKPATPAPTAPSASVAQPAPPPPPESNVIGPRRSAWDIARDQYNAATTLYHFPDGTQKKGSEITNWKAIPPGTTVQVGDAEENAPASGGVLGRDASSIRDLVGDEARAASTFYFPPGAKTYSRGSSLTDAQIDAFPTGTRVLVGYAVGGPLSGKRRIFDICGPRWNRPETYYLTPKGQLLTGKTINERAIPSGSWVFYCE